MVSLNQVADQKSAKLNAYALIVGVANYRGISSLPATVHNDARDIRTALISPHLCGYPPSNVHVLLDAEASLANIRAELSWLASAAGPGDSVLFYFSGHGALLQAPNAGESALVPWDAEISDLPSTCLSENELSEALRKIASARLLVLLDSCHSGGSVVFKSDDPSSSFRSGFREKSLENLAQGRGRVAIASSRSSETSLILPGASNSVFTAHLLEVLRGEGPSNGEGLVRVFQMFEYLVATVPASTNDHQHPILKASELEMNFPVALYKGGKKQVEAQQLPATNSFNWRHCEEVLSHLYPMGPTDRDVWLRAGGDLSRLKLGQVGRTAWFSSLLYIRQGGADGAFLKALFAEALGDFPKHPVLLELLAAL